MATTTELAHLIDINLRSALNEVTDLPSYLSESETASIHIRIGWLYEWEDMVDRIEWLARQFQNGDMSDKQAERYRELVEALRKNVPILRKLEWSIPLVAVESST